jgi:hypothetical protein
VTDAAAAPLASSMSQLRHLRLGMAAVGDAALLAFSSRLAHLTHLYIHNSSKPGGVTAVGVGALRRLHRLQRLWLPGVLRPVVLERLLSALPDLQVHCGFRFREFSECTAGC